MTNAGITVNGQVRFDNRADALDDTDVDLLPDDFPVPRPTETYAQHLAALRESIDDREAGRTRSAREVL